MFEIVVFGIIFLAVAYWAALWRMGRAEDVLHGHFVQTDVQPEMAERLNELLTTLRRDLSDAARQ